MSTCPSSCICIGRTLGGTALAIGFTFLASVACPVITPVAALIIGSTTGIMGSVADPLIKKIENNYIKIALLPVVYGLAMAVSFAALKIFAITLPFYALAIGIAAPFVFGITLSLLLLGCVMVCTST